MFASFCDDNEGRGLLFSGSVWIVSQHGNQSVKHKAGPSVSARDAEMGMLAELEGERPSASFLR